MQRTKEKLLRLSPILLLLVFSFSWIWLYRDIYWDPNKLLPRDNLKHHLPMFLYVGNYLKHFGSFPNWLYSPNGGIWLPALSNNFLVLMPHRLLGVWISTVSTLSSPFLYKAFLLLGQAVFLVGLYKLAAVLFHSRKTRALAVGMALVSGVALTFTYQEHALATLFFIPWVWICFLRLNESRFYLPCFFSLLGLSFNHHYPQLILIYFLVLALGALASLSDLRNGLMIRWRGIRQASWKLWGISLAAFFISASPVLFSYFTYKDKLESPFRFQKHGIESVTYNDYLIINTALSKLHPSNLRLYFNFEDRKAVMQTPLDESLAYMGPLMGFVLFGLIFLKIPKKKFHAFVILALAILSCGTYTFVPRILWYVVPGITLFRQWIFFLGFLNLHLLFLTMVVVKAFLDWKVETKRDQGILLLGVSLFLTCYFQKWMGENYALPVVFLFLLKVLRTRYAERVLAFGLYAWMILGTLQGAHYFMKNLRGYLNDWRAATFAPIGGRSDFEKFGDLKNAYRSFVALPKGLNQGFFQKLNQKGHFFYLNENLGSLAVSPSAFSLTPEGIKIEVEQSVPYLLIPQFNDGNWKLLSGTGEEVPLVGGVKGGALVGKIPPGVKQMFLIRKKILWNYLVVLMWWPLLILMGLVIGQKISTWFSRLSRVVSSKILKYRRPISLPSEVST